MKEFIVAFKGCWHHFFTKPGYGLCLREKNGVHFSDFEILLGDCAEDFYVLPLGESIHVVCQDTSGAIIYLYYDGLVWKKLILFSSKDARPYPKHFALIPVGSHINLYYVIEYKEKYMLVHQILNRPDDEPTVVDYISHSTTPFSVCYNPSGDITVCYKNTEGISGTRTYRWSQKKYSPFVKLIVPASSDNVTMFTDTDGTEYYSAVTKTENIHNLVLIKREPEGDFCEPKIIYLDCALSPGATMFKISDRMYLQWLDGGNVMMSYSDDGGEKWKKPIKYMRGSNTDIILYHIINDGKITSCYGLCDNSGIKLYDADAILHAAPESKKTPSWRAEGSDAADFAKIFGYKKTSANYPDYICAEEFYHELSEVKKILSRQNETIAALILQLEQVSRRREGVPIAQNDADIDRIVTKNLLSEEAQTETAISQTPKIVVTGK